MKITVATWNVHGCTSADGSTFDITSDLYQANADLVALQEFPELHNHQILEGMARQLQFSDFAYFQMEDATDGMARTGVACLSRWPMKTTYRLRTENPHLTGTYNGSTVVSHDKGSLVCLIDSAAGTLLFASTHLLPFSLFGLEENSPAAIRIWRNLAADIFASSADHYILAGDYNLAVGSRLAAEDVAPVKLISSIGPRPTRPDGRSHDDVLVDEHLEVGVPTVIPGKSDHYLCKIVVGL